MGKEFSEEKEFLINELKRWIEEHDGEIPRRDDMISKHGYPSFYQYQKTFNLKKWNEILDYIGIDRRSYPKSRKGIWQEWELEYLKENFYNGDKNEIEETLNRKWKTISSYASKCLNLNRIHGKYLSKDKLKRLCKSCNTWLPNNEKYFYTDRNTLRTDCIICERKNTEEKARNNGVLTCKLKNEKFNEGLKYCGKCKQWKPIERFYVTKNKNNMKYTDYHRWCSDCESIYHSARGICRLLIELNKSDDLNINDIIYIINKIKSNDNQYRDDIKNKKDIKNKISLIKQYINNSGYGSNLYASNGQRCNSIIEFKLEEFFIANNIKYKKEYKYRDLGFKNDRRRLDYMIKINDEKYYIEYFGIYNTCSKNKVSQLYTKKTRKKIKDLYKRGLINNCILIFPTDLNNKSVKDIFASIFTGINFKETSCNITSQLADLSDSEFLNKIMSLSNDIDTLPKMADLYNHHSTLYNEILNRYGGYFEFAKVANKKTPLKPKNYWTKDNLCNVLLYMYNKYGKIILRSKEIVKLNDDNLTGLSTGIRNNGGEVDSKLIFIQYCLENQILLQESEIIWLNNISQKSKILNQENKAKELLSRIVA